MLSILPRDLPRDAPLYLEDPPIVVHIEAEEINVLQVVLVGSSEVQRRVGRRAWPRTGRRRVSRLLVAVAATALATAGVSAWQRTVSAAPAFPSSPTLFTAAQGSSRWDNPGTTAATAVLPLVDSVDVFFEAAATPGAAAADAGSVHAAFLRGAGPSLVIDMTAEPRKAVIRMLSPTVLEIEAGPVLGPVKAVELAPSPEVPLVQHVSVREYRVRNRPALLRARILLNEPGQADIRVAGRFLYVDFVTPRYESF